MSWKNEFLTLFTSENITDFSRALALKSEHMPRKLYRYRPVKCGNLKYRKAEIVNGELFLEHPQKLNDPFEACSHLSSTKTSEYIINKEAYEDQFAEKIPKEKYNEMFSKENWYDLLISYVAEKTTKQGKNEKNKQALTKVALYGMEMLNAHLNETARKLVRFASFSTTATNLPMWHHYTGGHKGICLEYDTRTITNIYHKNMLFPVYYVERLPDIVSMMLRKTHPKFSLFEYIAMHKLKDWDYENEWRLIHDVGAWYYSPDDVPADYYTKGKTIRFIRPSKIIMGVQISNSHRTKIEKYASITNIPVVQAKTTEYGLYFE